MYGGVSYDKELGNENSDREIGVMREREGESKGE